MSEIKTYQGNNKQHHNKKIAIVASRFNSEIVDVLLDDAVKTLQQHGVADANISVVRVPGAVEIPLAAKKLTIDHAAVIVLGAVIRGETPHFDYVCQACMDGVNQVMQESGVPVIFGVLTTNTMEQAKARAAGTVKMSEKDSQGGGASAAESAIELIDLYQQLVTG